MKIGIKITYDQTPERLLVNVLAKGTKKQVNLITGWLIAWTLVGAAVISQIGTAFNEDEKVFVGVFLVFWLYFEFKAYTALRWRKGGVEIIKVAGGRLSYSREIAGKGKVQTFDIKEIKKLHVIDYSGSAFQKSFYNAFWSIGAEMVAFEYYGKEIRMAMQVEENDAKQLVKVLKKAIG